jgi:hypothetical protein
MVHQPGSLAAAHCSVTWCDSESECRDVEGGSRDLDRIAFSGAFAHGRRLGLGVPIVCIHTKGHAASPLDPSLPRVHSDIEQQSR